MYKGLDVNEDARKVAIKEIDLKKLNKQQLSDLNVEMNILSQLHHDSIVQLISVYSLPDKKFMVMEYLKGGDLLNAVCRREFYTEGDARALLMQIASALHYMHERLVIHRDIKPENLILSDKSLDSPIKLVDFGFAAVENEQTRKPSRYLCGTPGYMAPEVIRDRSYTTKVDIWALGVVFYILLSGLMPFSTDPADEIDVLVSPSLLPLQCCVSILTIVLTSCVERQLWLPCGTLRNRESLGEGFDQQDARRGYQPTPLCEASPRPSLDEIAHQKQQHLGRRRQRVESSRRAIHVLHRCVSLSSINVSKFFTTNESLFIATAISALTWKLCDNTMRTESSIWRRWC